MPSITLRPTASMPITFVGEQVAQARTMPLHEGKDPDRSLVITLYRRDPPAGGWVATLAYETKRPREWPALGLVHGDNLRMIERELVSLVNSVWLDVRLSGFPEGPQFADKRREILRSLRARTQIALSEALAQTGESREP